jgi:ATP-binding cassette subfamily F protein uup
MPELIASLEKRQKELEKEMAAPGFYQSGGDKIAKVTTELAQVGSKLEACFLRWEELESSP